MGTLKKLKGKYLLVLLAMAGLISSSLGIMTNAGGIFFTPIAEELGQPTAAVNLTLTICNLTFAIAGVFSAKWVRPKNFRPAVMIATAVFAGATALLSACRGLPALYACSAVRGFAAGLTGNVLVTSVIGKWFLSDTGFMTSLVLGCSGLVGALFNPILESVIRSAGWRTAYLVSAGIILLLNLPAIVFPISFLPEDSGVEAAGSRPAEQAAAESPARAPGVAVLALMFAAFSLASMVAAAPQLFKPIADTYGLAETGILMMSAVLVMNTAGKFLCGFLTDRIGVKRTVLICGLVIAAGVLLVLLARVPGGMLPGAAMVGLCYSIPTVCAVMICRELYSPDQYSRVFPKVNLGVSAANAVGYPILGLFYDRTGSYDGALVLVFCLMLLSVAGVFLIYHLAARPKAAE